MLSKRTQVRKSTCLPQDLANRTISAFLWGASGAVLRIALQVASQIMMARLLGPEQFGLFATGLIVIFATNLIADAGLTYGLVQKKAVSDDDIRFIFTWQMIASCAVFLVLLIGAPLIAAVFSDPRLVAVVRILSIASPLTALGATSAALLRRTLNFRVLNIASVVSYGVAFFGVAIPLAVLGYGVLALLSGFLLQALIQSAMQYNGERHSVRPLCLHPEAAEIAGFGVTVFVTNIVNWLMSNIDRAIIGAMIGVAANGVYATMQNLINTPATAALQALQPVFYSASSRVQGNIAHLRYGLTALFGATTLFLAPVFVGVATCAETFVLALYGPAWAAGSSVLRPLALAVPAILVMNMATPVLWTAGQPKREYQVQAPMLVIWALVCAAIAARGSVVLVSWAVAVMCYVRAAAIVWPTFKALDMTPREVLPVLYPGTLVSLSVAGAAYICDQSLALLPIAPLLRLLADIGSCALALFISLRLVRDLLPSALKEMLERLASRLPEGRVRLAATILLGT